MDEDPLMHDCNGYCPGPLMHDWLEIPFGVGCLAILLFLWWYLFDFRWPGLK